jgi:hypothetical protein
MRASSPATGKLSPVEAEKGPTGTELGVVEAASRGSRGAALVLGAVASTGDVVRTGGGLPRRNDVLQNSQ